MIEESELERPLWLGKDLTRRLRMPGPPLAGGHRSPRIGSIASSSTRFAGSLARPVPTRLILRGPEVVPARSLRNADLPPMRWWSPYLKWMQDEARHISDQLERTLPARGLPKAVHRMPDETNWTPGAVIDSLVAKVAPVRRLAEVTAAGPMLTSHDRSKLHSSPSSHPPAVPTPRPPSPPRLADHRQKPAPTLPTPAVPQQPVTSWKPALPSQLDKARETSLKSANPLTTRKRANALVLVDRPEAALPRVAAGALATAVATRPRSNALSRSRPEALLRSAEPDKPVRPSLRISDLSTAAWLMPSFSFSSWSRKRPAVAAVTVDPPARVPTPIKVESSPLPERKPTAEPPLPTSNDTANEDAETPDQREILAAHRKELTQEPAQLHKAAQWEMATSWKRATPTALSTAAKWEMVTSWKRTTPTVLEKSSESDSELDPEPSTSSPSWKRATPTALAKPKDPGARRLNFESWDADVKRTAGTAVSSPFGWGTAVMAGLSGTKGGTFSRNGIFAGRTALPTALTRSTETTSREVATPTRNVEIKPSSGRATSSPFGWGTAVMAGLSAPKEGTFSRHGIFSGKHSGTAPAEPSPVGSTRDSLRDSAERTSSSNMTDLLVTGKRPRANAQSESMLLATAFGAPEIVRPSTATTAHPAVSNDPAAETKGNGFLGTIFGSSKGAPKLGQARAKKPPVDEPASVSRPRSNATASSLLPAPPPVALHQSGVAPQVSGPAVPAVGQGRGLVPGPDGKLRRSLIDSTAALFAAKFGAAKATATSLFDDLAGHMNSEQPGVAEVVRVAEKVEPAKSVVDDPRAMQEIVDKVVERIETKVIDELERRGLRHNTGAF